MNARHLAAVALAALLIAASAAVALPSQAADQANDHADDGADAPADARSDDAGPADQARYGLCIAFGASETGRENGQAGDAGPFQWILDIACEDVQAPAEAAPAPV